MLGVGSEFPELIWKLPTLQTVVSAVQYCDLVVLILPVKLKSIFSLQAGGSNREPEQFFAQIYTCSQVSVWLTSVFRASKASNL